VPASTPENQKGKQGDKVDTGQRLSAFITTGTFISPPGAPLYRPQGDDIDERTNARSKITTQENPEYFHGGTSRFDSENGLIVTQPRLARALPDDDSS
jgi:hypothetical protein